MIGKLILQLVYYMVAAFSPVSGYQLDHDFQTEEINNTTNTEVLGEPRTEKSGDEAIGDTDECATN